jgi:hypothetical protein
MVLSFNPIWREGARPRVGTRRRRQGDPASVHCGRSADAGSVHVSSRQIGREIASADDRSAEILDRSYGARDRWTL